MNRSEAGKKPGDSSMCPLSIGENANFNGAKLMILWPCRNLLQFRKKLEISKNVKKVRPFRDFSKKLSKYGKLFNATKFQYG